MMRVCLLVICLLPHLMPHVFAFTSLKSRGERIIKRSQVLSFCYGGRCQQREPFLTLHAIPSENGTSKKRKTRIIDTSPLHASNSQSIQKWRGSHTTGTHQDEHFVLDQEVFELDLLDQKLQYEDMFLSDFASQLEETVQNEQSNKVVKVDCKQPIQAVTSYLFDESIIKRYFGKLSTTWTARLLLLLSAALNGSNFTFVKIMNEDIPVQNGTILRFSLAALATSPWLFQTLNKSTVSSNHIDMKHNDADADDHVLFIGDLIPSLSTNVKILLAGFEVGCWTAFGYVAQAIGLETIQASTSAFICSLAVIIVPMLNFMTGKKISSKTLFGAFAAFVGVVLLELDTLSVDSLMVSNDQFVSDGDIYTLLQPLFFAIGFFRMEHAMKKYPAEAKKLTAIQLVAVALVSICSCIIYSTGTSGLPTLDDISIWICDGMLLKSILWTGLINTALTIYMETVALKSLSAMETTILLSTEPLFGSIFAGLILGESFGYSGALGAVVITMGCLYSNINVGCNHERLLGHNENLD